MNVAVRHGRNMTRRGPRGAWRRCGRQRGAAGPAAGLLLLPSGGRPFCPDCVCREKVSPMRCSVPVLVTRGVRAPRTRAQIPSCPARGSPLPLELSAWRCRSSRPAAGLPSRLQLRSRPVEAGHGRPYAGGRCEGWCDRTESNRGVRWAATRGAGLLSGGWPGASGPARARTLRAGLPSIAADRTVAVHRRRRSFRAAIGSLPTLKKNKLKRIAESGTGTRESGTGDA